jgi:glycosyltransferase involved in cell wall biosynthesis
MRLAMTVEALSELGDLEFFFLADKRRRERTTPPTVSFSRVASTPYPAPAAAWRWRTQWVVRGGVPMEVRIRHFDKTPRVTFATWAGDGYDLVWFNTLTTYEWLGRPRLGPTVVDLDNLESEKEEQRRRLMGDSSTNRSASQWLRRSVAMAQARLNARDWRRLEGSVSRTVDRVVLCSQLDVGRSGLHNAEIVPNTYRRPPRSVGHSEVRGSPVVLFQGTLDYGPNADAATWLVRDLAPRIRARVPGAEIRLVGTATPDLERLSSPPDVTVTGRVPDIEPELARADLAVVPLRSGSGTRLKILESFAHRIPVVSTTMGAEGLDVEPGIHLLVADDPDGFASACQRLLTDSELRKRVIDAAERRYLERYESSLVKARIQALVREVAATGDR